MNEVREKQGGSGGAIQPAPILISTGIPVVLFTAIFVGRIVWEETILTMRNGPQMIGFSLAHGEGAFLYLSPMVLLLWLGAALLKLIFCLFRKCLLGKIYWVTLTSAILLFGLLSLPEVFWQWLLIQSFAKSPHAAEIMIADAAQGNVRIVRGYLKHGVPLESTNESGTTAVCAAADGGSLPVVEMLAAKGANLNATNAYGDSPLDIALQRGDVAMVSFLRTRGAVQRHGTPEQRDAAAKAIIDRKTNKRE